MAVNTVLGPLRVDKLGKTLFHEHFVFGYAGFQGDTTLGEFDREAALQAGISFAERVKAHGVNTVVDPTPNECGRNPELLREISERTGLQIICATGYYFEERSASAYFKRQARYRDAETDIFQMFMQEITQGIGKTGIKAGFIKVASGKDNITDYEKMFFRAAAKAHKETGVTIITHTQEGTMGLEQAELLITGGVEPSRIVIGHMGWYTQLADHFEILKTGVFVGFDQLLGDDAAQEEVLISLIRSGFENQILLSQDTIIHWQGRPMIYPEPVNNSYLFDHVIPRLKKAGISNEQIDTILIKNPQKLFGN